MSDTRIICEGGCGFPRAFCCCEPTDAMQDDVLELLRALKLPDCARPASPHRVVQDEILPAVAALTAENERLTREITNACDTAMRLDIPTRELVGRLRAALPSSRDGVSHTNSLD